MVFYFKCFDSRKCVIKYSYAFLDVNLKMILKKKEKKIRNNFLWIDGIIELLLCTFIPISKSFEFHLLFTFISSQVLFLNFWMRISVSFPCHIFIDTFYACFIKITTYLLFSHLFSLKIQSNIHFISMGIVNITMLGSVGQSSKILSHWIISFNIFVFSELKF